jgi:hypothetical protein
LCELEVGLCLAGLDGDPIDGVGDRRRGARDLFHAGRGSRRGGGLLQSRRGELLGGDGQIAGGLGDLSAEARHHAAEAFDHGVECFAKAADLRATTEVYAGGEISSLNARGGTRQGSDRPRGQDGEDDCEADQQQKAQTLKQRGLELLQVHRSERTRDVDGRDDHPAKHWKWFVAGQHLVASVVDDLGRACA